MKRTLREALWLVALVGLLGTAGNFVPRRHLPWWGQGLNPPRAGLDFQLLDPTSAELMREALPVVFLDTRTAEEFAAAHIPGAVRLPLTQVENLLDAALQARLRSAQGIVIYGASPETDVEQLLAQAIRQKLPELPPPYVLAGGFPAWEASQLPVEVGP